MHGHPRGWARCPPGRLARITVPLVVTLAAVVLTACGSSDARHRTRTAAGRSGPHLDGGPQISDAGGKFAGYIEPGQITSVGASWTVPAVAASSRSGKASTWIGAQAPGGRQAPFIQIGTQEEMRAAGARGRSPVRFYEAFFSDTHRSFHPYGLFAVRPGDRITARMGLALGRWTLAIADQTSGMRTAFTTREEASGAFNYALWLQEDVTNTRANTAFPYPDVAAPRMSSLSVNGVTPSPGGLLSTWMSLPGGYLGPTPVRAGAFSVVAQKLSAAGARYLRIATAYDAQLDTFEGQVEQWQPPTPRAVVQRETATFIAALSANVSALRAADWPASAAALLRRVESADAYARRLLQAAAGAGAVAVFQAFRAAQTRFSANESTVRLIRQRLNVQQLSY